MLASPPVDLAPATASIIAPAAPQDALLTVSLNGDVVDDSASARIAGNGDVFLLLADLEAWRLAIPANVRDQKDADGYVRLAAIPGLTARYDAQKQALELTAAADLFVRTKIDFNDHNLGPMTPSAGGAFANYNAVWTHAGGRDRVSVLTELGAFVGNGSGSSAFVIGADRSKRLLRLDTNWTFYDVDHMSFIRAGDSISRGSSVAPPYRFAGLQISRDFGTSPGYLTMPLPSFSGSAALPSSVDVISNGILLASRPVSPGPFDLSNLPVTDGNGQVQVIVQDVLGQQSVTSLDVYTSAALLRTGLSDYSYEVGFLRRGFGTDSFDYGSPFASATFRRGLSDSLTGEVHADASSKRQSASAAATILTPVGVLDVGTAASKSELGFGEMAQAGLQYHSPRVSVGLGASLFSRDFQADEGRVARPRSLLRAMVHTSFGRASLGLTYIDRTYWNAPRFGLLSLGASLSAGHFGYLNLSAFHSLTSGAGDGFSFGWSMPVSNGVYATLRGDRRSSENNFEATLQRNLPEGTGFGFRAAIGAGDRSSQKLDLLYQNSTQTYELDVVHRDGDFGVRGRVSGSVALIGTELVAARLLTDSFAVVDAGVEGVRVYADNHLMGRTNERGILLVPNVRAFDRTKLRIEQGDLPIEAKAAVFEKTVRPYRGAGVRVDYSVQLTHDALVRLTLDDGSAIPSGATARINDGLEESPGTPDGQFYLLDLQKENSVTIRWEQGECNFNLEVPAEGFANNDAGSHVCKLGRSK